ncbi:uncharacterized protein N7500_002427 [Penicillium coprophilum]|uniref:uncharacterized protein n=1 Tax=Penicillium coprophilum TaxID=36646 RepID=UPI0023A43450|nr:uncharacterized protein N7500_002427 [Penicillium coprophilum]KAJ5169644.1 hypothetical protein N7500_002427 [Penicillium coprophilum]
MHTSDPPVSSNWDFTPVHDLLRSPIEGCTARPSRHNEATIPLIGEQANDDPRYTTDGRRMDFIPQRSNPKLGDFGSLWELFNGSPAPASVTPTVETTNTTKSELEKAQSSLQVLPSNSAEGFAEKGSFSGLYGIETSVSASFNTSRIINEPIPQVRKDTSTGYFSHSSCSNVHARDIPIDFEGQSFTILKRTSDHEPSGTSDNVKFGVRGPQSPPVTILKPRLGDPSDTPIKSKPRSRRKNLRKSTRNHPITSEESAGLDSDTSIVFDHHISEKPVAISFVPSQVHVPGTKTHPYDTPPSSFDDTDWILNANAIREFASGGTHVRSTLHQSAADRRVTLMTRLLGHFPAYAKIVSQVGLALDHPPDDSIGSRPIHVFVDMSNIMVGFHDSVKTSRNIPLSTRIRRVHMSFANLALIMERGRRAAKRVLVGSDRLPSVDEAERLGYEVNILERVHKVKTVTPRHNSKSRKNYGYNSQGVSSGPETVAASEERWVEQGVDEILHLKILESLLDTEKAATIVLATGDAAVAEFSDGFMRMVERALQRGWNVELVSFSQGTSYAYRKKEFRTQWGACFKLVELDRYVEELFE